MRDYMAPDQIAKYRENTRNWGNYSLRTRTCTACRRTRSMAQFQDGKTICRRCCGLP